MQKFLCKIISMLLIFIVSASSAFAQTPQEISNELSNKVSTIVSSGKAKGAILSIVKDGETQLCNGYGFADEHNGFTADGEKTAFRIGSVSKIFVAVAAQILHQEGRLDLDCDITAYLEHDFPSLLYPVSMRQLLTHTAGFEDMVTGMAVFNISDTEPLSASVRKYMPGQVFKPGEVVSYSNYGIALAAYVVERIANQDFAQYCREQIFLPLEMNKTTYEHMQNITYVSKPYLPNGGETLEPYMNLYPEGSAVSTAGDMARFIQWLLNKEDIRVLSVKSKEELFKKQFSMSDELEGVGFIWNRKSRNNKVYYDKKGETLHFYSRIALYPETRTGIFLSFNTYLPEHEINAVMGRATDLLYGEAPQAIPYSGKAAIDIKGTYTNNWSSFETPEKILRYLVPGKILKIDGTQAKGYFINGKELIMIGEDSYSSPMGIIKFLKKEGTVMIATESAITYSKIPFWQNSTIQMLILVLFFALVLICLLRDISMLLKKKSKLRKSVTLLCSLVQLFAFCVLCLLIYNGIITFSLLSLTLPIKICGWLIFAASFTGIVYAVRNKAKYGSFRPLLTGWSLVCILFCAWMFWMNIL